MTPANTDAMTATIAHPFAPEKTSAPQCGCGHLDNAHDLIAARFCAATRAGALIRGCICHPGSNLRSP